MSLSRNSNVYLSTATELQALPTMTEETKLYREAAMAVLARPENRNAGPKEKDLILTRRTLDDLIVAVNEAREQNKLLNQKDPSVLSKSARAIVDTLSRFEKAITSMAQSKSEVVMPIWGPIQFLVRIASEIFDTLDRLNEIGQRLTHCLARYRMYTTGDDLSGPLRRSLVDFYIHVIQFSITASRIYWKRRIMAEMATLVFKTSVKKPFDQFITGLDYLSGVVEKDASAENYQNIRSMRKTWPQSPDTLIPRSTTIDSFDTIREPTAGSIPRRRHVMVPDLLSSTFYGREDVLECVRRSLLRGRQTSEISRAAIWGLPGIGKTQIALCYERRHRAEYRHVFFVNASGAETIVASYRAFLQALFPEKEGFEHLDNSQIEKLMKAWLANNAGWLLIYDNAIIPAAVRQYTPVDSSGHILFTTRNEIAAEALVEREEAFEIFALPPQHAIPFVLLLQKIELDAATIHDEQVAQRLAKTLLGIPIAIEQSVLLARLRNVPLSKILPEVESRRTLFKQSHPASMHEHECSMGALVSMTLETLAARSPPAASLFQLLVFFHTSSIPIEIITKGSKQLDYHFARQETYNRGLREDAAAEIQEMRRQGAGRRPFYEENPFEKSFWKSRMPFQAKKNPMMLPRVDTAEDQAVEKFVKGDRVLRDVLEKDVRIEHAILDLKEAGLIRRPDDKTIWIHDLFAQLTIARVEEESRDLARNIAHLVLLTIYLTFPIPNRGYNSQLSEVCLPHAMSILRYCLPFYRNLTMGPELAHLTASTLDVSNRQDQSPDFRKDLIYYYKLALHGYHAALQRLQSHPESSLSDVMTHSQNEYALAGAKGLIHVFYLHHRDHQRFGSSPAPRAFQTTLKIGKVYGTWHEYEEAAKWTKMAVRCISDLYGVFHDETEQATRVLLWLYKEMKHWDEGYILSRKIAANYMKRWGGGLVSEPGAWMAQDIGDCALGLRKLEEADQWYHVTLRGLISAYGDNDRSQFSVLLSLTNLERFRHDHAKSLEYASKAERIYRNILQQPGSLGPSSLLPEIQVAIARQHLEMGHFETAKEWCEKAFQGPRWGGGFDRVSIGRRRSAWLSRVEAVWIWGCGEYGESSIQDWEIPSCSEVTKEMCHESLSTFGPLKRHSCDDYDREMDRWMRLPASVHVQELLERLDS